MKKEHRIRKNEQFQQIIKRGMLTKTHLCYGYYAPNSENILRVGIAVSKKIGNAVVRNKIKRQIRAIVRPYVHTHSGDFVFVAKRELLNRKYEDLQKAITKIFDENGDKNGKEE